MSIALLPDLITEAVTDLTPEMLAQRGVKLLMLDFDNTIVPYTTNRPTEKMSAWLKGMQNSPVHICVVSNSRKMRVRTFCEAYGMDCITHAKKPFSKGIQVCMTKYCLPAENCALAGDQIYTDVLGANCAGIQSILVKAIDNHTILLKGRHILEKPWIWMARKRRLVC